jgi:hypothetical protein
MATKPTLNDTAHYFQQQADRTRKEDLKAHYRRCADHYSSEAKKAEPDRPVTRMKDASLRS